MRGVHPRPPDPAALPVVPHRRALDLAAPPRSLAAPHWGLAHPMRPRHRPDVRLRRRASMMRAPVASLTGSICPTTLPPTTTRSNASGPPWRLRSKPWRSARGSCALSPATRPAPTPSSRSCPTRNGRTTWFDQRTAAWPPVRWLSHCGWHLRPAGAMLTSAAAEEARVPMASAFHVSRPPIWPGAEPGPALCSPAQPGPARTALQEPVQLMLLGLRQDVSSFGPKLRTHVRLPHEFKHLSKPQKFFPVKNSEIWQESLGAR